MYTKYILIKMDKNKVFMGGPEKTQWLSAFMWYLEIPWPKMFCIWGKPEINMHKKLNNTQV
jgi:hypothetical protein